MALLMLARDWAQAQGHALQAVTVDHGLRLESASEASVVARICAEWDIPHTILKAEGLSAAGNLQAAARDARYRLMAGWAAREGLSAVALGHTMDDQAETVLMRLGRGAGAEGLSAMAAARSWLGACWLRPLLSVRRQALRGLLKARGVGWLEDPSNDDPRFDRVRARQALDVLGPLGITVEGLADTAATMMRQRQVLHESMVCLAAEARDWHALGFARLSVAALADAVPDTALRLFADTLQRVSGAAYRARFRSIEPLFRQMVRNDARAGTLSGCLVRRDGDAIVICREPGALAPPIPLAQGETDWDRRWRVSVSVSDGLVVGALGAEGLSLLAEEQDTGLPPDWHALPAEVRVGAPAIWQDAGGGVPGALIAVPHAGFVAPGTAHLGEIAIRHLQQP